MRNVFYFCLILSFILVISTLSCARPTQAPKEQGPQKQAPGEQTTSGEFQPSNLPTTQPPASTESPTQSPPEATSPADASSGATTVTTTGELPEGWPEDVPIMEGFTITRGTSTTGAGGIMSVIAEGSPSIKETIDFYSKLEGWQPSTSAPPIHPIDRQVIALTKGELMLHVIVRDAGNYRELVLQLTSAPPKGN